MELLEALLAVAQRAAAVRRLQVLGARGRGRGQGEGGEVGVGGRSDACRCVLKTKSCRLPTCSLAYMIPLDAPASRCRPGAKACEMYARYGEIRER